MASWRAYGETLVPTPKRVLFRPLPNTTGGGLSADVYLPESPAPAGGYPVALYLHGGGVVVGNTGGHLRSAHQTAQILAAGIAVVSAEYRLQPHVMLEDITGDVKFALDWIREGGFAKEFGIKVDAERVGVYGHSSGGQLSSWLALTAQPPLRAVIDAFGYCILPLDLKNETPALIEARNVILKYPAASSTKDHDDPSWAADEDPEQKARLAYSKALFGVGNTIPEGHPLPKHDPYSLAHANSPPFLILHGTSDDAVPFSISERFHAKLVEAGADAQLVPVPGAGHGWTVKEGAEGVEGERWEIDHKAFKWFTDKILA